MLLEYLFGYSMKYPTTSR